MKLKIMIMALLLLTGIGSAVNWIPESQMEPGTSLTFNGGHVINGTRYIHNIVDYGAIAGDDICDVDAIEAAIAAASPGDTILFPTGIWNYEAQIDIANDLIYAGLPGSELRSTSGDTFCLYSDDASNVTIDGLVINGSKDLASVNASAVVFNSGSDIKIINTDVINAANSGIVIGIDASSIVNRVLIDNCKILDNGKTPCATGAGVWMYGTLNNITFTNNVVTRAHGYGIYCSGLSEAVSHNLIVTENRFIEPSKTDISMVLSLFSNGVVSNNIVQDAYNDGIGIWRSGNFTISDNVINNVEIGDGIVLHNSHDCVVVGNRITKPYGIGINLCDVDKTGGVTVNNSVISNVIIGRSNNTEITCYGIQLHYASYSLIAWNVVRGGDWTYDIGEYSGTTSDYNIIAYNWLGTRLDNRIGLVGSHSSIIGMDPGLTGFGTANPRAPLHVVGCGGSNQQLELEGTFVHQIFNETDADANESLWQIRVSSGAFLFRTLNDDRDAVEEILRVERTGITTDTVNIPNGEFGVGGAAIGKGQTQIYQTNASGAIPVLLLRQYDVSEEMIRFIGSSTTDASQTLTDAANLPTPGSIVGWLKIYVEDVQGTNPITDGYYYVPFYTAPT